MTSHAPRKPSFSDGGPARKQLFTEQTKGWPMNRSPKNLALLFFSLLAIAGCAGLISRTPAQLFDHDVHVDSLVEHGFGCMDCHYFTTLEEREFPEVFAESRESLFGQLAICHYCHVDSETRDRKAPYQCLACHTDMDAIRPPTHIHDWTRHHGLEARNDRQTCVACHNNPVFCADCHTRRDTVLKVVHPRPYRYFHGIEAQADPASCNACHTANFCIDCHSGRRRF
jgi:hypothetical protein